MINSWNCPECGRRMTVQQDDDDDRCLVCVREEGERLREEARQSAKSFWSKHPGD